MAERPLILFPRFEESERANGSGRGPTFTRPTIGRQMEKFAPKFEQLQRAIETKHVTVQSTASGMNPETALVLEVVGGVDSFYSAVRRIDGLEWMFDISVDGISDEDFSPTDAEGNIEDGELSGKVYCVMTNKQALDQLLSLWRQYVQDPDMVFQRGYAGFRDVFRQLKDIRYWSPLDRLEETHVLDYWRENLEFDGSEVVNFEVELFFRNNLIHRSNSSSLIRRVIQDMGGDVLSECQISEITFHSLLVSLPRNQIENLVNNYEEVQLTRVDDIMFFRPVGQIAFPVNLGDGPLEEVDVTLVDTEINSEPVVALFDGLPMQNHSLLNGRLVVDDPNDWARLYVVKNRVHGTAMSSLILHNDLNSEESSLNRKIYVRPIFLPTRDFNDNLTEKVPNDVIIVDLIHMAVRRLFEGDSTTDPVAPKVKIINLSMGDPSRQFVNSMSPLARLLDWLSYKYKVLFIVSAGNHSTNNISLGMPFSDFARLSPDERGKLVLRAIEQNSRNMRLLSPAESINSLSVGAIFSDASTVVENDRFIFPYTKMLPSPISAIGSGYNRSIKPDIFYPGGRKFLKESLFNDNMNWVTSLTRPPGCCVAFPGDDETSSRAYTFGTSDATALMTHYGGKCFDVLEEIFLSQTGDSVPDEFAAVIIKSMLVHGAEWDTDSASLIAQALEVSEKRVSKWLGNGIPDVSKVMDCAKNRATLIGYGSLTKNKAHVYKLPIPFDFVTGRYYRKLTVTLAYLSPTVPSKQKYRSAQLWFTLNNNRLLGFRKNTDDKSVKRSTVQHEIFFDDRAVSWDPDDSIEIKVNCKDDADTRFDPISYGLLATFELAQEISDSLDIDVYSTVVNRIREAVTIQTNRIVE
ncbi:S8 family peptidase [Paenibacillus aurantius]|uniref:S8 family peptidase n=1 Tax=Paenibacillus aurantius TaxID=2918900 RepID=A0AA96LDZ4_9BACL|nr:S8 family peptidase [Paenibacillus aurantius]WNQ11468.1 S8 family peptidase [Paenibacillus aurantius]